jgi:hypothetical protein
MDLSMFVLKKIPLALSLIVLLVLGFLACSQNANKATPKPVQNSFITDDILIYGGNDQLQDWLNAAEAFVKGVEPSIPPFAGMAVTTVAQQLGFKNTQIPNLNKPVRFLLVKRIPKKETAPTAAVEKSIDDGTKQDQPTQQDHQPTDLYTGSKIDTDLDFPESSFLLSIHLNDADQLDMHINDNWKKNGDIYYVKLDGKDAFAKRQGSLLVFSTHQDELNAYMETIQRFDAEKYSSQTSVNVNLKAFAKQVTAIQKEYASNQDFQRELKNTPFMEQFDLLVKNLQEIEELSFVFHIKPTEVQFLNAITFKDQGKLIAELKNMGKDPNEYLKLINQPINALVFLASTTKWKDQISEELKKNGINAIEYAATLEELDRKSLFLYASTPEEVVGVDANRSKSDKLINQCVSLINQVIDVLSKAEGESLNVKLNLVESTLQDKEFYQIDLQLPPEMKAALASEGMAMNIAINMLSQLSIVDLGDHSLYSFGPNGKTVLEKHMKTVKQDHNQAGLKFLKNATAQTFLAIYFDAALINQQPSQNQYLNAISMLDQNRAISELSISRGFAKAVYDLVKGFLGMFSAPSEPTRLEPMNLEELNQVKPADLEKDFAPTKPADVVAPEPVKPANIEKAAPTKSKVKESKSKKTPVKNQ